MRNRIKRSAGKNKGEAHKKRTVVVDAGHGGPDGGKNGSQREA